MAINHLLLATGLAAVLMLRGGVSILPAAAAGEVLSLGSSAHSSATDADRSEADEVNAAAPDDVASSDAELTEEARLREQQLLQDAEALRAQLASLSNTSGTYDAALIEVQQDLGRTYLELQQYDNALDHLLQALQLLRVNEGLYSERQVDVLKELIAAAQGQQAWEEADDYHHLLFAVQSRLYEEGSEEQVDALIAFAGWRVYAARQNLLARGGSRQNMMLLEDMQQQQERALEAARERGHVRQQWDML